LLRLEPVRLTNPVLALSPSQGEPASKPQGQGRLEETPCNSSWKVRKLMKQTILAIAAIGMTWLLVSMAPDIRRYLRIRAM
jgi:hypothetical protein